MFLGSWGAMAAEAGSGGRCRYKVGLAHRDLFKSGADRAWDTISAGLGLVKAGIAHRDLFASSEWLRGAALEGWAPTQLGRGGTSGPFQSKWVQTMLLPLGLRDPTPLVV